MRMLLRVLLVLLVIVLVLGALGFGYAFFTVRRPWPRTNGKVRTDGLQAEVTVARDSWGVPHVYASNSHDLFFVQPRLLTQNDPGGYLFCPQECRCLTPRPWEWPGCRPCPPVNCR